MISECPDHAEIIAMLQAQLLTGKAAFSMGVMGAIGEFFCMDETLKISVSKNGGQATAAGGGISLNIPKDVQVVAYESVSGAGARWSQGILFTLPVENADLGHATGVQEVGLDQEAVSVKDKDATLFELGLGHPHFSFGIRIENKNLIAKLRDAKGVDLFTKAPNVLKAVLEMQPHRVVQTLCGRIEATNPFNNLCGPHTHLVPSMIGRTTHTSTLPVAKGYIVGLSLQPESPWQKIDGQISDFNRLAYEDFQKLFKKFAPANLQDEKARLLNAIESGLSPKKYEIANDRATRLQARATLRQLRQMAPDTPNLENWFRRLDRTGWMS